MTDRISRLVQHVLTQQKYVSVRHLFSDSLAFLAGFTTRPFVSSSVIPSATGDEVIKFWKVKVGGGGMHSTEPF